MKERRIGWVILAMTQTIGWGVLTLPAVLAPVMSRDIGVSLSAVFSGFTIQLAVMAFASPWLAPSLRRFGAKRLMCTGTCIGALGMVIVAASETYASYVAGWMVLGLYGTLTLTTPAYVHLNAVWKQHAKSAISGLMLVTGLAGSIFWPLSNFLGDTYGWRGTGLLYGGVLAIVSLPLMLRYLPIDRFEERPHTSGSETDHKSSQRHLSTEPTFLLLVGAVAANGFVSLGFEAVLIELLRAMLEKPEQAVGIAAGIGVLKVAGRALDLIAGKRLNGLQTAVLAAIIMLISLLVLRVGNGHLGSVGVFAAMFGLASGAFAVARATLPLFFFDGASYSNAMSSLALPLNLTYAAAPVCLMAIASHLGPAHVIDLCLLCVVVATGFLLMLARDQRTLK